MTRADIRRSGRAGRTARRTAVAGAIAALAAIGMSGVASAHVVASPGEIEAGQSSLVTLAFSHGCDGSATTRIRIQMPESVPAVAPTINPGWVAEKVMADLDEPIAGAHGEQLTQRVAEVVYTANTPIPDGFRDTFVLSFTAPDTPGETLYFPTIQTCEEGETAWIDIPADDQTSEDLESPAPSVEIVAATDGEASH